MMTSAKALLKHTLFGQRSLGASTQPMPSCASVASTRAYSRQGTEAASVAPRAKGKMSAVKQTKFYMWRNAQGYPGLSTLCRSQCEEAVLHFKLMKVKDIPGHTVKEMTALIRCMDDAEIQEILQSKSREQIFTKTKGSSSDSSKLTASSLKSHETKFVPPTREESQKVKLPCPEDDVNSSIAEGWDHHLQEALHFLLALKPAEAEEEAAAMMLDDMRELGSIHVNTQRKVEVLQLIYQLNQNMPQVGLYGVRGLKQTNPEKASKEPEKTAAPAKWRRSSRASASGY